MQTIKKQTGLLPLFFAVLLITLAINVHLTKEANANPYGPNYQPPRDPNDIYIEVNGTINPASAPIQREGNVYTLTGNITGHPIWVLCNNIVFDGAGYTLKCTQSGYETGLTLNCTKNVTLKNIQVSGYYYGITVKRLLYVDPAQKAEPDASSSPYPESTGNTIINCTAYNSRIGIFVRYSKENQILKNAIANSTIGIQLESYSGKSSTGNLIKENQVKGNSEGILLNNCMENTVTANIIIQNKVCGLELEWSSKNKVYGNTITENEVGILVEGADGVNATNSASNIINNNQIAKNNQWGIRLNGSQIGNKIYANNFIDNNLGKGLQVSIPMYMHTGYRDDRVYVEMLSGRANIWNNASAGNYWSDYQTRYPNATKTENATVWDTPFYINENNIDHYPLTSQLNIEISDYEDEQTNPNVQNPQIKTPPYTFILLIVTICIVVCILLLIYKKRNKKIT